MTLKIFTQPNCPKCPAAKKLAGQFTVHSSRLPSPGGEATGGQAQFTVEEYDVSTVDGLAEAAFYQVMATPSLILVDEKGKVVSEWRGEVPSEKDVLAQFTARQAL